MNFAATTSLRNRAGGRPATNSILRRLPALVTSVSLTAMLFVTTATTVAAASPPAFVQAQGLTGTTVEVMWTPVAGATSYSVYRDAIVAAVSTGTSTHFDDGGRAPNTTYTYQVTATVGSESAKSSAVTAVTQGAADVTSPAWSGCSCLTLGPLTYNSAALSWPHASDVNGVVGFRILRGEDPAAPVDIITTDVALSYTATNLKASTAYTFAVQAIDAANNASSPITTSFTTPAAPGSDVAPPPVTSGSVRVTAFSDTRIDISWGTQIGAVGYKIYRDDLSTLIGEVDEPASPWFSDNGVSAGTTHSYAIVAFSSGANEAAASQFKPSTSATALAVNEVKVVRGPTVQWVTSTSARVAWWTNIASTSRVDYGIGSPSGTVATDAFLTTNHVVLLAPLTAATAYQYKVGNGVAVSSTANFMTSAAAGSSFSFDAIGDYGAASTGQTQNAGRIATDGAQFLQTLGDNVYSEASDPSFATKYSEFDGHFFKPMQPAFSAKALWTANGNKEYYGLPAWFNAIWAPNNEKWYSYDWGDAHIVVLDSSQPFDPASAQFTWAQTDLQAHQSSVWRIVVIQDPAYSSTSANSSSMPVETSLVPLFQTQGVQLVLSGNSHNYERSKPLINGAPAAGGITYVVSGNGGNAFNPFTINPAPSWSAFRQDSLYGYLKINVSPTALTVNEISASDGTTLDTATINAPIASGGSTYVPLTPARLLDTRFGTGLSGKFVANNPRTFQVTGLGGVPVNAVGVTGNFTVTNQTAAGAAFLGPNSTATPATSTLNFPLADTRANGVTLALSPTGTLSATYLYTPGATTDFIFDVTGYFVPDTTGASYVPLTPARLLDTRFGTGLSGKFVANNPRTFQVTGLGGVPANAVGVTGNFTVTNQTAAGAGFLGPNSTATPATSTLNFPLGDTRANGVTLALSASGQLSATYLYTAGATTDFIFDVTGYFVPGASGAKYVPQTPARLLDTRFGTGLSGKFVANNPRTFQVRGLGGVPASAVGVTGNFTVTNQTAAGAGFLGPNSTATPATSTLNFPLGDTRANGETLALSASGQLSATYLYQPGATTDFIWDVTGYFIP